MKRIKLSDCLSQHFTKVSADSFPERLATETVFAVFDVSTTGEVFRGLVTKEEIAFHENWTFAQLLTLRPQPALLLTTTPLKALALMQKEKIGILAVVDEEQRYVGIVTCLDLIQLLYQRERKLRRQAREKSFELALDNLSKNEAIERAQAYIKKITGRDYLTGLPNLPQVREQIAELLNQAEQHRHQGAVLLVDIDNFKDINDMIGSYFGDQILRQTSTRIAQCLRKQDILARKGADEFIVVLLGIESADEATLMAKSILNKLTQPFFMDHQEINLTASVGICFYPVGIQNVEVLLANADIALGQAKDVGKNNYQIFMQEMGDRVQTIQKIERYLRQAITRDELFICYQPQVEINSNSIVGMEALLRWQNPELGLILPSDFIPLAEKTGLITPIGDWVLRTACLQGKAWHQQGNPLRIAVNLSAKQFQGPYNQGAQPLIKSIEAILKEINFSPELLEVEITESMIMKNYAAAMYSLKKLKNLGIRISCDDFGTGYSSLNYLKRFPIDTIKIDKSFIDDIGDDPIDVAIIRAIIVMAQQLNIEVIAEGVEKKEQLAVLRDLGCSVVQGYLFSKPLTSAESTLFIQNGI